MEQIKYRRIADALRENFLKPEWVIGMKVPPEHQLMSQFSASRITVRAALTQLTREGIIDRKQGKPSVLLQKPPDKSKMRSGLNFAFIGSEAILDSQKTCCPNLYHGIITALHQTASTLSIYPSLSPDRPQVLDTLKTILSKNLADGIFLAPTPDIRSVVEFLRNQKVPFVVIEPAVRHANRKTDYSSVTIEEQGVFDKYVEDAAAAGAERIVLAGSAPDFLPNRTDAMLSVATARSRMRYEKIDMDALSPHQTVEFIRKYTGKKVRMVSSSTMIRQIDFVLNLIPGIRPDILFYHHFAQDISEFHDRYSIMEPPVFEAGLIAAEMMQSIALKQAREPLRRILQPKIFPAGKQDSSQISYQPTGEKS